MRVLFDTSVIVAANVQTLQSHHRALPWARRAQTGDMDGIVSSHSLAEIYRVLIGMTRRPRIRSSAALEIIENVRRTFEVVHLDENEYFAALESCARLDIRGGTIYDALIAHAAVKANAEQIVTFNERHFARVSAGLPVRITAL